MESTTNKTGSFRYFMLNAYEYCYALQIFLALMDVKTRSDTGIERETSTKAIEIDVEIIVHIINR